MRKVVHVSDDDQEMLSGLDTIESRVRAIRAYLELRLLTVDSGNGFQSAANFAKALIRARASFPRFVRGDFYVDPGFDMLLDLFVAAEAGHGRSVGDCSIAARTPVATTLRYLDMMETTGLIERRRDSMESPILLTPTARASLTGWLRSISSVPLVQPAED